MSLIDFLEFRKEDNYLSKLDVRSKMLFVINQLLISFLTDNILILLISFGILLLILFLNFSNRIIVQSFWQSKYFFILLFLLFYFLTDQTINFIFLITLKLYILLYSFYVINKTINPDEIVDVLIKLRIPANISWMIGTTFRQSIFTIDDISDAMAIYDNRAKFENKVETKFKILKNIRHNVNRTIPLISTSFSQAIINSIDLGNTLAIRGFEKPHRDIVLHTSKMTVKDVHFIFLSIIFPNLIIFLLTRWNIYIT